MSDKVKIDIFNRLIDRDTYDLVRLAEEEAAVKWAQNNESWGEEGQAMPFNTPVKNRQLGGGSPTKQVSWKDRPCRVCNGKKGCNPASWRDCPALMQGGVKLPFCVACRNVGHSAGADCPVLQKNQCTKCSKFGHRSTHCPTITCPSCQGNHIRKYCPNKNGGRG